MSKRRARKEFRNNAQIFEFKSIESDMDARINGPQDKKKFHLKDLADIQPKTDNQRLAFRLWQQQEVDCLALTNQAGTGKTLLAMYFALQLVLDSDSPYEKVIIIRSAVQGREIGHLPGTEEDKNAAYEAPYSSVCDDLFTWKKSYINLKKSGKIEFHNTTFLRGLTFKNAIVIFDESQNANLEELSTVITRIHSSSRLIICGDTIQNDLHRKKNDKSGMEQFVDIIKRIPEVGIVSFTLDDIIRGGLVKSYLTEYTKYMTE